MELFGSAGVLQMLGRQCQESSLARSGSSLTRGEDLSVQIVQLKEKAHQSFMQVIQMQQLHEEELEEVRTQAQEREQQLALEAETLRREQGELQGRVQALELRVQQLEYENGVLERNYRHHNYDIDQDDLEIDNIEPITCPEESQLDDSAIVTFREIVESSAQQQRMADLQDQLRGELSLLPESEQLLKVQIMVQKLFEYLLLLKSEFVALHERSLQFQRQCEEQDSKQRSNKTQSDSLQRETKFMAEHIKRLSQDKMRAEKRLVESEKTVATLRDSLRRVEAMLAKKGIKVEELLGRGFKGEEDHSLDLNEFIELNFTSGSLLPQPHKAAFLLKKQ